MNIILQVFYISEVGMIRSICIFGDSVAKGVVFDSARNKYSLLKDSFANIIGKQQNIDISNYAKFGCTISMGTNILTKYEDDLRLFDYTLLEFGGNDCDYKWSEVSMNPFKSHLCNTPITQFREQYIELIERIRSKGGKPVLLTLPPIDPKRYFKWISNGLNAKNILTFLGDVQRIHSWQGMYSAVITELASVCKVPLIDIRSSFLEQENFSDYLCEDGIHPNSKGHLLISKTINTFK